MRQPNRSTPRRGRHARVARRGLALAAAALCVACSVSRPLDEEDSAVARGGQGTPPAQTGEVADDLPIAPVAIELDRTQYPSGGTINLRLVNRSAETYGYNPCTRTVEVREGGRWRAVLEPDRVCTMELRLLAPNETALATTDLPDTIADGEFRLSIRLSPEGAPTDSVPRGPVRAVSAAFRVR